MVMMMMLLRAFKSSLGVYCKKRMWKSETLPGDNDAFYNPPFCCIHLSEPHDSSGEP